MTDHKQTDDFTPPDDTETHGHEWDDQAGDGSAWAWVLIIAVFIAGIIVGGVML